MKKCLLTLIVTASLTFGFVAKAEVSKEVDSSQVTEQIVDSASVANADTAAAVAPVANEPKTEEAAVAPVAKERSFHQVVKEKIIEGGVLFMSIVLLCLIIGLTIAVERVITLNLASTNVRKLLTKVKDAINLVGVQGAKDVCVKTPGPVASILAQGFIRIPDGKQDVKDAVESYGSAEMMRLEKGMSWISLFISLAPMFGFMGTVIGMIDAFDTIQIAEDIKIDEVAGGIKTALLTTVAGLVVAVILQVFYNYLTAKLDSLAEQMEDASNSFIDILLVTGVFENAKKAKKSSEDKYSIA